ncbi:uncharacterized protein J4E88_009498 [Alternaria novae-zelandiae]|uniref:uncharacterized protein n=1 Tax=Alternaria novae-zelandiae TaxID=430562 RepID=UPI0020C4A16C|nr:uncharacterized protein J4E88_009498 [Alternaria novae-zelandiae]KAI4671100.1 hypothetical protein J4E88_009498 [Alternaria novae-zelandiae]
MDPGREQQRQQLGKMGLLDIIEQREKEDRAAMEEYNAARNTDRTAGNRSAPDTDAQPPHPGFNPNNYGMIMPFDVSENLITGCNICPQQTGLSRCSACKVVHYCSPEHQRADRPAHKVWCKSIKKITFVLDKDEAALRAHKGDMDTPPNAFETAVGDFWRYSGTRNYMRSRNELLRELPRLNTKAAVEAALEHALGLMRLNLQDPMCVRSITPAFFLRLGRDQEAYDFCKWWVTKGSSLSCDWKNVRQLPHEMGSGGDAWETVEVFERVRNFGDGYGGGENFAVPGFSDLSHLVAVTLVKVRMLLDVRVLIDGIRPRDFGDVSSSSIVLRDTGEGDIGQPEIILERVKDQVLRLYHAVHRVNKHFWPRVVEPRAHLLMNPLNIGMGEETEMHKVLPEYYCAWSETPGAIEVIEDILEGREISFSRLVGRGLFKK